MVDDLAVGSSLVYQHVVTAVDEPKRGWIIGNIFIDYTTLATSVIE